MTYMLLTLYGDALPTKQVGSNEILYGRQHMACNLSPNQLCKLSPESRRHIHNHNHLSNMLRIFETVVALHRA